MRVSRGGPWARPAAMLFIEPPLCRHGHADECSVASAVGAFHTSARAYISSLLVRARAPNSSHSCGLSSRPASDTKLPNNKSKDNGNPSNNNRGRPTPQAPEATTNNRNRHKGNNTAESTTRRHQRQQRQQQRKEQQQEHSVVRWLTIQNQSEQQAPQATNYNNRAFALKPQWQRPVIASTCALAARPATTA